MGRWVHVALTVSNAAGVGTQTLYGDGRAIANTSVVFVGGNSPVGFQSITLGLSRARSATRLFDGVLAGAIGSLQIYGYPLSLTMVEYLAGLGGSAVTAPPFPKSLTAAAPAPAPAPSLGYTSSALNAIETCPFAVGTLARAPAHCTARASCAVPPQRPPGGAQVVRGQAWGYNDTDGGPGSVGVVVAGCGMAYEVVPVNMDHPKGGQSSSSEWDVRDRLGYIGFGQTYSSTEGVEGGRNRPPTVFHYGPSSDLTYTETETVPPLRFNCTVHWPTSSPCGPTTSGDVCCSAASDHTATSCGAIANADACKQWVYMARAAPPPSPRSRMRARGTPLNSPMPAQVDPLQPLYQEVSSPAHVLPGLDLPCLSTDNQNDCAALITAYHAWGNNPASWPSSTGGYNSFAGVGVSPNGRVSSLVLPNAGLVGPIPAALCDLPYLTKLVLSYNSGVTGAFPRKSAIGGQPGCNWGASSPARGLTYVALDDTGITNVTGVGDWAGSLQTLSLSNVDAAPLPGSLSGAVNLTQMFVDGMGLGYSNKNGTLGIDKFFANMGNLATLVLDNNGLKQLPTSLGSGTPALAQARPPGGPRARVPRAERSESCGPAHAARRSSPRRTTACRATTSTRRWHTCPRCRGWCSPTTRSPPPTSSATSRSSSASTSATTASRASPPASRAPSTCRRRARACAPPQLAQSATTRSRPSRPPSRAAAHPGRQQDREPGQLPDGVMDVADHPQRVLQQPHRHHP